MISYIATLANCLASSISCLAWNFLQRRMKLTDKTGKLATPSVNIISVEIMPGPLWIFAATYVSNPVYCCINGVFCKLRKSAINIIQVSTI